MELEELKKKHERLKENSDKTLHNMDKIADESLRVADVAHNAKMTLEELDHEFESQTGLKKADIPFLFVAVGLQMLRIYLINWLTQEQPAGHGNRNEKFLHDLQDKILSNFEGDGVIQERPYYASLEHIITTPGVPYDAQESLDAKALQTYIGKGASWDFSLEEFLLEKKPRLFKGANHRFATLGHDPIWGLLFGTSNIMTNTITCVDNAALAGTISLPVLTTRHVVYSTSKRGPYKYPLISVEAFTLPTLQKAVERTKEQPDAFVASLIKQIIHIATDLYTPKGIFFPGANLVLSNTNVEKMTSLISTGDVIKIGASAGLATFINFLISAVHTLMYDPDVTSSRELYNVRTRKIIMVSNTIATGSNLLWVGANMYLGNENAVKQLDIGGLLVTIHRLYTDMGFIRNLKEEFVFGGFQKMIKGDTLDLEEPIWD